MKTKFIYFLLLIGILVSTNATGNSLKTTVNDVIKMSGQRADTGELRNGGSVDNFVQITFSGKYLNIAFFDTANSVHITIENANGAIMYSNTLNVASGTHVSVNMTAWARGFHTIILTNSQGMQIEGAFILE